MSTAPEDPLPDEVRRPSPALPLASRLRPWIDWFGLGRVIATAVTIVAVVAGGWWLLRTPAPPTEAGLPFASTTTLATAATGTTAARPTSSVPSTLVVHVAGAVARPGVYELPAGARVHAALDAAGGALADAAPGSLNLAAPVGDGARVYVPAIGEDVPPPPPSAAAPVASVPSGPVDLNRATATELDGLPGIGPATAQAIVDHRLANGPFASVDDLEAVRGIGPAKLDAIRALVTV